MTTRSGQSYGGNRLSQQQRDDLLLEIAHQMGSLSKRVDTLWSQVFDTRECSGEKNKRESIEDDKLKGTEEDAEEVKISPRFTTPGYQSQNQHHPRIQQHA
jgi:hypothetical protein